MTAAWTLIVVSRHLGHSNTLTAQRHYVRKTSEADRKAVDAVAERRRAVSVTGL